jgi:hypothetical protein
MTDSAKLNIAKQAAKLFLTQMASVPADVQLMTVELLARTIFETGIKAEKRIELADQWFEGIRDAVEKSLKPKGKTSGKK